MWQLPRKKLPNRIIYLSQLIVLMAAAHIFLLLGTSLGVRFGRDSSIVIRHSKMHNASVVLLPLHKVVPKALQQKEAQKSCTVASASVIKEIIQQKKAPKKIAKVASSPKKPAKRKTQLAMVKDTSKPVLSKTKVNAVSKKPEKVAVVQKAPKKEVKQIEMASLVKPKPVQSLAQTNSQVNVSSIMFIGQDELAALEYEHDVRSALKYAWHPPVGVPEGSACTVAFAVNSFGRAKDINIEKSSSVLVYDIAVKSALMRAHFSKRIAGKTCTVEFTL